MHWINEIKIWCTVEHGALSSKMHIHPNSITTFAHSNAKRFTIHAVVVRITFRMRFVNPENSDNQIKNVRNETTKRERKITNLNWFIIIVNASDATFTMQVARCTITIFAVAHNSNWINKTNSNQCDYIVTVSNCLIFIIIKSKMIRFQCEMWMISVWVRWNYNSQRVDFVAIVLWPLQLPNCWLFELVGCSVTQ